MTCELRDDVAAHLLGALSPDEALMLEQHLLLCDDCAQQRREFAIVRTVLDSVDVSANPTPPHELRDAVVTRMIALPQRRPARDFRIALLGAAAAVVLIGAALVGVRAFRSTPAGSAMELVAPSAAPKAWAIVNLHARVDGTIVDLEAGDLPHPGGTFTVKVTGNGEVLASQQFEVDTDGWAQVLLATSRPMQRGDLIEISQVGDGGETTVLRCSCSA